MDNEKEEQSTNKTPGPAKHNSGAADLEKVTDYAEEQEIAGGDLNNAISAISGKQKKEANERAAREKLLASVKIKKEDVEVIVNEFEVTKIKAERVLREHNGNLESALSALLA